MAVDRDVRLFLVAHLGDRVDLAGVDPQVAGLLVLVDQDAEAAVLTGLPVAGHRAVQLPGPPRWQPELPEPLGVGRGVEGLLGDQADGLVVSVAVVRGAGPAADDDERLHGPDRADDLADDGVAAPVAQRVLAALGEPEVVERPVEHLAPVEPPGVEALPRPHDAEGLGALGPTPVLPALPTGGRPVDGAGGVPSGHVGDQAAVLVVGVRAEVQHRAGVRERPDAVVPACWPLGSGREDRADHRIDALCRPGRARAHVLRSEGERLGSLGDGAVCRRSPREPDGLPRRLRPGGRYSEPGRPGNNLLLGWETARSAEPLSRPRPSRRRSDRRPRCRCRPGTRRRAVDRRGPPGAAGCSAPRARRRRGRRGRRGRR